MSTQSPKPKRRWYQFSLLTLLVVMLFSCCVFAWIGPRMRQARENRDRVATSEKETKKAVAEIETLSGGEAKSMYQKLRPQTWLEKQFDDPGDADNPVGVLKVSGVALCGYGVGDADLEYLKELTSLQELYLSGTEVSDAGLEYLKGGLSILQTLDLSNTEVTDTGLEHLKGLTSLQELNLANTNVTAEGVEKLQQALPHCQIDY
jgi:hypothetical protein